jgi:hypothetical protein
VRSLGLGGAVALGTAAAPGALLASAASAQTGADAETGAPRPELPEDDLAIAAFAEGVEWALVELYGIALESPTLDSQLAEITRNFQEHHREHAGRLTLLRDGDELEEGEPNAVLVAEFQSRLEDAADSDAVLEVLYELEERAAATYADALGDTESVVAAQPMASILPVEAQHAVALGEILGLPEDEWMPAFQTTDDGFDPQADAG